MRPRNVVVQGDALTTLRGFASGSIDAVITSPPYLQARNYRAGPQELGQEAHVEEWVANLRAVSREIHRVLKPTGSYWLNVGDGYSRHPRLGAPAKSLLLGPERLIRALLADGWLVRNRICWAKSNPMPSPVRDRLTSSWEYLYHLVKQPSYYYDLDAIRLPLVTGRRKPRLHAVATEALGKLASPRIGLARLAAEGRAGHPLGKNPTDVWTLSPGRQVGGHRATFPEALVKRPILATVPPVICTSCGEPWRRSTLPVRFLDGEAQPRPHVACSCRAATARGLVLDPFAGTGTTLKVARELHRDAVGIELSPRFAALAHERAGFSASHRAAA